MEDLLTIVHTTIKKVQAEERQSTEVMMLRQVQEQTWAEEAYKDFEIALSSLNEVVDHFEIAPSHGNAKTPCLLVTDILGRKFEIFYCPSKLANSDYRFCAQRKKNPWYDASVYMNKFRVAEQLGRWLAEIPEATDSLKCK